MDDAQAAIEQLYDDSVEIDERARAEVTIERSDGRRQRYAAVATSSRSTAGTRTESSSR